MREVHQHRQRRYELQEGTRRLGRLSAALVDETRTTKYTQTYCVFVGFPWASALQFTNKLILRFLGEAVQGCAKGEGWGRRAGDGHNFYDSIDTNELVHRALDLEYPANMLRLAMQVHRCCSDIIQIEGCSIIAGCRQSTFTKALLHDVLDQLDRRYRPATISTCVDDMAQRHAGGASSRLCFLLRPGRWKVKHHHVAKIGSASLAI
jgi:hypothetical protein